MRFVYNKINFVLYFHDNVQYNFINYNPQLSLVPAEKWNMENFECFKLRSI